MNKNKIIRELIREIRRLRVERDELRAKIRRLRAERDGLMNEIELLQMEGQARRARQRALLQEAMGRIEEAQQRNDLWAFQEAMWKARRLINGKEG